MCREHIRVLERQVLLANLEKDRTTAVLKEQVDAHEKTMTAMKLEKRSFAEDIMNINGGNIAIQNHFCTCHAIEFEKGMNGCEMPKFDNSVATIKLIVDGCQSNITNIHRVVILSTAINQAELLLYVSGSFNKKYPRILNLF